MSEYKEVVTTSDDETTDGAGARVHQKVRRVNTDTSADGQSVITNAVWFIVGVIEVGLAFRFVLKLLGANPGSGFVDFVYSSTNVLTAPFDNIFGVAQTVPGAVVQSVIEPSILVAAAVYGLLGWAAVRLLNLNRQT